ncbi:glycogenin-1-like isoform X2 [Ptychodera flava]|uniref:glycogenin-1-like isoform X2 n=1 Tax=Ptychodera flava TaxID=63121 RepID=UPI00396A5ABE
MRYSLHGNLCLCSRRFKMAASQVQDEAFVTLATNDRYAYGALVLGHSLRAVNTTRQLAVMITPTVSSLMRQLLTEVFHCITQVDPLDSNDEANLALLTRPELGITFSKLHCWRLTQYNKCVFMDADTLVLRNIDDLFEREELSAAPDVGWPDLFNSGVFVFKPSEETYRGLLQCAMTQGSFDGGDQGLLNTYFSDWGTKDIARHLPFIYNMTASRAYSYLPAFVKFGSDVKVVHFIGAVKPWEFTYDTNTGTVLTCEGISSQHELTFIQAWWDVFVAKVKPRVEAHQCIKSWICEDNVLLPDSMKISVFITTILNQYVNFMKHDVDLVNYKCIDANFVECKM